MNHHYTYSSPNVIKVNYNFPLKADLDRQSESVIPLENYYDCTVKCEYCKTNFEFTREEQKYWYEDLKFNLSSFPRLCKSCKKIEKELHNEINYIQTQFLKESKRKKVEEYLDKIIKSYGFIPSEFKRIEKEIRKSRTKNCN
ncbi:MAG: zinc-ribbon domain-containing protein [Lentisphaeria bacterium]|nr:zinc-ribbon domain-containing protein [Lentisphaeria bacterium]